MNPNHDPLSDALRDWRVTPPAAPGFRQGVWQRIGRRPGDTWPAYLRAHAAALALASLLALAASAYTGSALARSRVRADRDAIVVTYLVDLDPRVQAALRP